RVSPYSAPVTTRRRCQATFRSFFTLASRGHSRYKRARTLPALSSASTTMDLNCDPGSKRKRSSVVAPADRPTKHLRPENASSLAPADATLANGTVYDVDEDDVDPNCMLPLGAAQADSPEWQATIESVVK